MPIWCLSWTVHTAEGCTYQTLPTSPPLLRHFQIILRCVLDPRHAQFPSIYERSLIGANDLALGAAAAQSKCASNTIQHILGKTRQNEHFLDRILRLAGVPKKTPCRTIPQKRLNISENIRGRTYHMLGARVLVVAAPIEVLIVALAVGLFDRLHKKYIT